MPRKTTRFENKTFPSKPFEESALKKLDKISAKHGLGEKLCPRLPQPYQESLPFEEHLHLIAERYRQFVATEFATLKENINFLNQIKDTGKKLVKLLNKQPPEAGGGRVYKALSRIRSLAEHDRSVGKLYKTIGRIEVV